nr:MAG TPA: hypothetical protein [Caudoviricetes sp.]
MGTWASFICKYLFLLFPYTFRKVYYLALKILLKLFSTQNLLPFRSC